MNKLYMFDIKYKDIYYQIGLQQLFEWQNED